MIQILTLVLAFVLLAGLIALPFVKGAGPGRVVALVVLGIVIPAVALALVGTGVVPTGDDDSASQAEEETLAEMEQALEAEVELSLTKSPSVEALRGDHPTVWQFEQDYTLLCAARDFPDSKVQDCWAPDGAIGADPLGLDEDLEDLEDLDLEDLDPEELDELE